MSDPRPDAPPPAPPSALTPPPLTEDQLSGALFVRWNLGAWVIGLVLFGLGLAAIWNGWAPGWRGAPAEASSADERAQ